MHSLLSYSQKKSTLENDDRVTQPIDGSSKIKCSIDTSILSLHICISHEYSGPFGHIYWNMQKKFQYLSVDHPNGNERSDGVWNVISAMSESAKAGGKNLQVLEQLGDRGAVLAQICE